MPLNMEEIFHWKNIKPVSPEFVSIDDTILHHPCPHFYPSDLFAEPLFNWALERSEETIIEKIYNYKGNY